MACPPSSRRTNLCPMTDHEQSPGGEGQAASPDQQNAGLKLIIELGPLLAFFVVQRTADIMAATGVFMAATVVSVIASRRMEGRWPTMPLVTGVFVVTMGGLTLALDDATFIYVKPTFTNVVFSAILFGGLARGRLFLKLVFGEAFQLDEEGWKTLTIRFGSYFLLLAGLNELVWRNFTEDRWTDFKVFGILPLTLLFTALQTPLIQRHSIGDSQGKSEGD